MWNFTNAKLTDHEAGHVVTKPDSIIVEVFAPALTSINASLKMLASRQLRLSIYVKDPITTSFGRLAGFGNKIAAKVGYAILTGKTPVISCTHVRLQFQVWVEVAVPPLGNRLG